MATSAHSAEYPTLATTWHPNGDLWVGYASESGEVYARFLDYPAGGWQTAEQIDALAGTAFTRLSLGVDRNGNLLAMYVNAATPQVYYKQRISVAWDSSRTPIDTSSEWPVVQVRTPNDATYGSLLGVLYWKMSASETYFFRIPAFEVAFVPILGMLLFGLVRRRVRSRADNQRAN